MIPRFVNPHFLPQETKRVSRSEILSSEDAEFSGIRAEDEEIIGLLKKRIQATWDVDLPVDSIRSRKRRKTTPAPQDEAEPEPKALCWFP